MLNCWIVQVSRGNLPKLAHGRFYRMGSPTAHHLYMALLIFPHCTYPNQVRSQENLWIPPSTNQMYGLLFRILERGNVYYSVWNFSFCWTEEPIELYINFRGRCHEESPMWLFSVANSLFLGMSPPITYCTLLYSLMFFWFGCYQSMTFTSPHVSCVLASNLVFKSISSLKIRWIIR